MYEFAILAFGGLVTWLAVRLLHKYGPEMARTSGLVLTAALGVGFAYLADYSLFAAWGMSVRSEAIGTIVTGFMVAGFAMLWEEAMGYFRGHAHGHEGKDEKTLRRAA